MTQAELDNAFEKVKPYVDAKIQGTMARWYAKDIYELMRECLQVAIDETDIYRKGQVRQDNTKE